MGDDGKISGEDGGAGKVPGDDIQCSFPDIALVREINLGGHGQNDEVDGRFSPYDFHIDCRDTGVEGREQRMGVPNYEVVEFHPWTLIPPKHRLRCLFLHIYS